MAQQQGTLEGLRRGVFSRDRVIWNKRHGAAGSLRKPVPALLRLFFARPHSLALRASHACYIVPLPSFQLAR